MSVDGNLDRLGGEWPVASMPGRLRRLAWCCGAFAVSVATVTAIVVAAPGEFAPLAVLPVGQLVAFATGPVILRLRLRRLLRDPRYRTVGADAVSAAVLAAVTASGVRRVTIRTGPGGRFARCFRAGGHAVLLLHERLPLRPDAARFMVAHETAHVARHDPFRRATAVMTILICSTCLALGLALIWPPAAVLALPAAVAAIAFFNRAKELDCDRLAVRWVGPAAAEQAFSLIETAYRQTPRNAIQTARALFTHPAPRRRLAACRAVRPGPG